MTQIQSDHGLNHPAIVASLMTAIAGYVDAIGYSEFDRLYLSFMSGNSTRLGMAISEADGATIVGAVSVIAGFVLGSVAGAWLADAAEERKCIRILSCEFVLVAAAIALIASGAGKFALILVAVAMGMQNMIHQVIAGANVGRTFVTGALSSAGQSLALALKGRGSFREPALYGLSWLLFVTGVVLGSVVWHQAGLIAALAIVAGLFALLIVAAQFERL